MLIHRLAALTGIAVATLFLAAPANALTMAECSTKYNAAKDAGTLAGQTWNQFRKAQCGSDATATDTKAATDTNAADTKPAKKTKAAAAADDAAKGLSSKECSTKYQAAKSAGTLNGMKWNDFRKAECGPGATAAAATAPATKTATTTKTSTAAADGGKGLTMAECSTKYQAAKTANKLNGMKWNDFRKAECGAGADDDDTVPAPTEATFTKEPAKPTVTAPKGVTFPAAISPKFANETPAKGRMHTCLEQYYANKDANTLNGLKWIQKGGGFYSLCNAKLKS
ncbi:hypothetical protein LB534_15750 [Mesorhizobium sp. CA18]|uniref:hypothetical protein n=1 Tax=unclassified Mesorhizobium TaxID=325217 RepID=UPI001CCB3DAB|nr:MULTISPECIES: hypothetical protein [unclassified Mesorhizobium]MBZ9826740.1 hypothetical protein [Mesorhizobium sp. CA18]MBZ9879185.1 hypothetical protein [Mesorhizobium sp. Ca11]